MYLFHINSEILKKNSLLKLACYNIHLYDIRILSGETFLLEFLLYHLFFSTLLLHLHITYIIIIHRFYDLFYCED